MNDQERMLLRYVVDGDIRKSRQAAKIILESITSAKDSHFKERLLKELDAKPSLIELPPNLQGLLRAEDSAMFPIGKYYITPEHDELTTQVLRVFKVSQKLMEKGIRYLPTLLLHGESGCGKTELARYIAYKADLPFVLVRFSGLVDGILGNTQKNLQRVFDYANGSPCVLCFDELDAIGMRRGTKGDVAELSRVTIALMQELDTVSPNRIIIGTTNRYLDLDPALSRRFTIEHKVMPLKTEGVIEAAEKFLSYCGMTMPETDHKNWLNRKLNEGEIAFGDFCEPIARVIKVCTEYVVQRMTEEIE